MSLLAIPFCIIAGIIVGPSGMPPCLVGLGLGLTVAGLGLFQDR
jgi:hypothetical protein